MKRASQAKILFRFLEIAPSNYLQMLGEVGKEETSSTF